MNLKEEIKQLQDEIIQFRRHIHANPELSFQEFKTTEFIKSVLNKYGIENYSITETGVIGIIGKGEKCVALRADIDALPINEETGLDFCSMNDGIMHACGHDMHTAMLLAAAIILKKHEPELSGTVKLIFQPAEEKIPGGAKIMIDNGVLENPAPSAVFGQHIYPETESGTISLADGLIMASADELYWTIKTKSGHAAQPHLCNDVILASSQLVVYLQSLMTKFRDPLNPGVLSVTSMHGGSATNVYPDELKMMGTFRSYNNDWRMEMHKLIESKSKEVCAFYNTECEVEIKKGYVPVINDKNTTEFAKQTAINLFGEDKVLEFIPKMWGEDFGYYSQKVPSTFWFLGVKPKDKDIPGLHNSKMIPEEEAMLSGTEMMVKVAIDYLNSLDNK